MLIGDVRGEETSVAADSRVVVVDGGVVGAVVVDLVDVVLVVVDVDVVVKVVVVVVEVVV